MDQRNKKIGFLGCGQMAQAIMQGLLSSDYDPDMIYASDRDEEKLQQFAKETGIQPRTNESLIQDVEVLVLAVKPQVLDHLLPTLHPELAKFTGLIISIAAGRTLAQLTNLLGEEEHALLRTVPNTPALVHEGLTALTPNDQVSKEQLEFARSLFATVGDVTELDESLVDAWSAMISSSPAFTAIYIESLADAGVMAGLPRAEAYRWAAQAVKGTAELYLQQGGLPAKIKDQVCSPMGSSIYGVAKLEEQAFRATVIEAVDTTVKRTQAMSEQSST